MQIQGQARAGWTVTSVKIEIETPIMYHALCRLSLAEIEPPIMDLLRRTNLPPMAESLACLT